MKKTFSANIMEHFLFNSLNCAVALCRTNPNQAAELLVALSDCLHYTSGNKKDLVLLEEELEFVSSYLFVQTIRFPDRLKVVFDSDKKLDSSIPRFSFYELVDNMLSDALKTVNDLVTLKIDICEQEKEILVSVIINEDLKYTKSFPY